jgi:biopolymer transport protein ExbB
MRAQVVIVAWLLASAPLAAAAQEAASAEKQPAAAQEAAPVEAPTEPKAKPPAAKSLSELLELVGKGYSIERTENEEREKRFRESKVDQERLLAEAKATLANEEARSASLETQFQESEKKLAELELSLTERLGSLGELFGVVRQVSGDTRGHLQSSLVSAELDASRQDFLEELGKSKELPSIDLLERLWYELQREMTEQGKVSRFEAPVLTTGGGEEPREVVRAGVFSAVSDGEYLLWEPEVQKLRELNRQPPAIYLDYVSDFQEASSGLEPLAVDPSRGSLLAVLIDTKTLFERIPQGGPIGYATITLGIIAGLMALLRIGTLSITSRKVAAQEKSERFDTGNPLGRVLAVSQEHREADPETLELKLDEVVMRESGRLERFMWLIKVVSVVAPLLGLLGTVTGMIKTFQSITLFGAGDPRMMASGISEALVTTMLGLFTAIPLVLLYSALANMVKKITDVLDERSAGLIAERAERANV